MYNGWLAINGDEVVNTHRAHEYAKAAGLGWVKGCTECVSVTKPYGGPYVTPKIDADNGNPPPWWGDGSNEDAIDFLGVMGVTIQNVDDSTRNITTIARAGGGGFIGSLTNMMRTITVRAVLVAGSDCALGFGLEWLRSIDSDQDCANGYTELFDCCPSLTAGECDDPTCIGECVEPRLRSFYNTRLTIGPTVLRRVEMARGAMAEVEFIIACADPGIYAPVTPQMVPMESVPTVDPLIVVDEPVDVFAVTVPQPANVPIPVERTLPQRTVWERQEMVLTRPVWGLEVTPEIVLSPTTHTEDVRLTLLRDGEPVMDARVPAIPMGGIVRLDRRSKRIYTTSGGVERVNGALVRAADGTRFLWPRVALPNSGEYVLHVDRAAGGPLVVEVSLHGRATP